MKKTVLTIVIIISLIIINNLTRSIYNLWQKQTLVQKTEKELERQKKDNDALKREYTTVKNPSYVETVARDKLFLAKPGESVVVLPSNIPLAHEEAAHAAPKKPSVSNIEQWLALFALLEGR